MSAKIVKDHGEFRLVTEEDMKKQNEYIMVEFKKKVMKAK